MRRLALSVLAPAAVLLAAIGCRPPGPPPIGHFLHGDLRRVRLGRVVFVELASEPRHQPIASETSEALYRAIQATNLFHVDVVSADHEALRGMDVNRPGGLTLRDLSVLRKEFRCNALLVGSMTQFKPYPRMHLGLYMRLLDLRRGRLLWGVDHVWETTEEATQKRIRYFYKRVMREGCDPVEWDLASVSPKGLQKFVAWEVARSLMVPDRPLPARGRSARRAPTSRPKPAPKPRSKLQQRTPQHGKEVRNGPKELKFVEEPATMKVTRDRVRR